MTHDLELLANTIKAQLSAGDKATAMNSSKTAAVEARPKHELERLEIDHAEATEAVTQMYQRDQLAEMIKSNRQINETDGDDMFVDGKRRLRKKPRCNRTLSALRAVNVGLSVIDDSDQAARNRARIERYNVERPEHIRPEHTMYPRESRNASPTRKKDAGILNPFWEFRQLHVSSEPLQSNYMQPANENFSLVSFGDDNDVPRQPVCDVEAEWEIRPTANELIALYSSPTVTYEIRMVHVSDYPRMVEPGYCLICGKQEMKIPVGGDVDWMRTNVPSRIGGLRLAVDDQCTPYSPRRGQVTHYRGGDRWFRSRDQYGTPYGPESKGSDEANWKPLCPRTTAVAKGSPTIKAKQRGNRFNPTPCPMTADEAYASWQANGRPGKCNQADRYDGLPFDVEFGGRASGWVYLRRRMD